MRISGVTTKYHSTGMKQFHCGQIVAAWGFRIAILGRERQHNRVAEPGNSSSHFGEELA